jgi:hypothetical protein
MPFASVYPNHVARAERKGRTKDDVDRGHLPAHRLRRDGPGTPSGRRDHIEDFFAEAHHNPSASLITGVVCGVRVESVEDPWMQKIRYLDKLVDELAKGRRWTRSCGPGRPRFAELHQVEDR